MVQDSSMARQPRTSLDAPDAITAGLQYLKEDGLSPARAATLVWEEYDLTPEAIAIFCIRGLAHGINTEMRRIAGRPAATAERAGRTGAGGRGARRARAIGTKTAKTFVKALVDVLEEHYLEGVDGVHRPLYDLGRADRAKHLQKAHRDKTGAERRIEFFESAEAACAQHGVETIRQLPEESRTELREQARGAWTL